MAKKTKSRQFAPPALGSTPVEAQISAELYHQAKLVGLQVFLEVTLPLAPNSARYLRADAIVVHRGEIVCVIETKRGRRKPAYGVRRVALDNQAAAYQSLTKHFGRPHFWLKSTDEIPPLICEIQRLIYRGIAGELGSKKIAGELQGNSPASFLNEEVRSYRGKTAEFPRNSASLPNQEEEGRLQGNSPTVKNPGELRNGL